MSLDKWIKPKKDSEKPEEKDVKSTKKKASSENNNSGAKDVELETPSPSLSELTKFELICTNSKCKYRKLLKKKQLKEKDKICPRCKMQMRKK